ncbi:MAG: sigma 54-interacting transcriptional regulator [Myxococcaceae bacterium]|nr:sigma 54-interacting transcriptional regulator [Myxococcaceae bacterium]
MTRRRLGMQDDDDPLGGPTQRQLQSPFAPPRVNDETLPATQGFRVGPWVQGFRLTAENKGGDVAVNTGVAQVGSDSRNDLVLTHPTVSRFHCEVKLDDERVFVRDLGSTNGTLIDGVRVQAGWLRHGSVLQLGAQKVRFELVDQRHALTVSEAGAFGELTGDAPAMRAAFRLLELAAKTDSTLIIEGETGTGKSRAAQALHEKSARANGPFMVVDCGALPPTLLEAELFGHEKGAFTGATARRLGVFEEAKGGTVLLDEIGEMPLELQPRLLRVLENKEIRRLGQNQWSKVDVRILAATHRDLRQDVNSGRFRQDLYFRLAVARVMLPPLRERTDDLAQVAVSLLERLGATREVHARLFAQPFLEGLKAATWPGNVRELRNYLERCILFEEPVPLGEPDAAPAATGGDGLGGSYSEARQRALDAFERAYLTQLLAKHSGKVAVAATEAGVDRVYLYRLIRKHNLKVK